MDDHRSGDFSDLDLFSGRMLREIISAAGPAVMKKLRRLRPRGGARTAPTSAMEPAASKKGGKDHHDEGCEAGTHRQAGMATFAGGERQVCPGFGPGA